MVEVPKRLKVVRDFKWLKVILDEEIIFKVNKKDQSARNKVDNFIQEKFIG